MLCDEMENPLVAQAQLDGHREAEEAPHYTSEGDPIAEDGNEVYEDSEDSEEPGEYEENSELARDEMSKFERIFRRKGLKFRMIDRIGEGMILSRSVCHLTGSSAKT